jgi:hypothetical protein
LSLRSEPTSKTLEKKLLIAGFEVPDILAIFLLLSILNFLFGSTGYKLALVWAPTAIAAIILRIGKRGKPDNYLVHLAKFLVHPKYLSAFAEPKITNPPPKVGRPNE